MRIKNVGKCTIIFKGGVLEPGKVAIFNGGVENIGSALLKAYPKNLLDLDATKPEEVVSVVIEEPKPAEKPVKEPVAKKTPAKRVAKKSKK